ncbi:MULTISPECIES: hypothetical protein [Pseudomonas]|uniref:Lipoprotein n=1 Tax=Pseudomonas fluorescens TaxID=294 RepID=A0A166QL81_PSEFL|nr:MULTISPECIES: hypothetical protein [Pseudomonas]KZN20461.1 hypothetical protein A1D17_02660 [Pseudomonas fluorescens]
MKNTIFALVVLTILAGCDAVNEKGLDLQARQVQKAVESRDGRSLAPASAHNCVTTGPNSPIVVGANSVVVIDGKTYSSGQSTDCAPSSNNISTHGANSPIVTGAGSKVVIKTDQ